MVLDQVPPWQIAQLRADRRVAVGTYRLPTIHVLLLNYDNRLLGSREFRRALCYGIDRAGILQDLVLAKEQRPGFRAVTGPMPAGLTITDPVGYAYNQQLPLRPYEPRLASVLATVARASLAKEADASEAGEQNADDAEEETPPLILAYPPEPVARICCQTISLQLAAIGIPIELKELSGKESELPDDYDLLYAELAIQEPLVDARRLLGPKGIAGFCSPTMSLALERVDQAKNWREAHERLQDVHEAAYYDLPVIPLWQTLDAFAYRKSLQGLGTTPVTLYQNVADWRITYDGETP
jgi:ABC-type transport system substrate-binding protein